MPLMATLTMRRPAADCLGGGVQRAAAAAPEKLQARPANDGRRQRGRKSSRDGAPVQPQKRVMENVVILKRGEKIAPKTAAAPAVAVAAPAAAAAEEKVKHVAAADGCGAPEEKTDKAPSAVKTETKTAATDRCSAPAMKAEVVAGAVQCGTKAKKAQAAPTSHSGASFVISPDPRELPIPVLVLKPRRDRAAACA